MEEAQERLRQMAERTKAAEHRAAEAKRVAQLKAEETARQERLQEMQDPSWPPRSGRERLSAVRPRLSSR